MPKQKDTVTATNDNGGGSALALLDGHDELAGVEGLALDDLNDGLSEVDRDDVSIAALLFNFKGTAPNGKAIPIDAFYNSLDETVHETVDAVFVEMTKTNLYQAFNNSTNKNDTICSSSDRVTGTMHDGVQRPCQGCPDTVWHANAEGKRVCNCGPVYHVFGIDRGAQQLFHLKFKRTSLKPWKQYLAKHHIGRRVLKGGQRVNYPLCVFGARLSLVIADTKKATHSLPVIQRTGVLTAPEIAAYGEAAKTVRDQMPMLMRRVSQLETKVGAHVSDADDSDGGDAGFDPGTFGGDVGKDFVGGGQ